VLDVSVRVVHAFEIVLNAVFRGVFSSRLPDVFPQLLSSSTDIHKFSSQVHQGIHCGSKYYEAKDYATPPHCRLIQPRKIHALDALFLNTNFLAVLFVAHGFCHFDSWQRDITGYGVSHDKG
tara:strand:+ start:242 stop:607 length:366 start_codon:yes stop_codon:yes gene_type:complete